MISTPESDHVSELVPGEVLRAAMYFYRNEPILMHCRDRMSAALFPPDWFVCWKGAPDSGGPAFFNSPAMQHALRDFFLAALDSLRVFHFVALWRLRDLAAWFRALVKATTPAQLKAVGLPFGVLPWGSFDVVTQAPSDAALFEHTFAPRLIDGKAAESTRYIYELFTDGLTLEALTSGELAQDREVVNMLRGADSAVPWSDALRKPVSAIYALRASSLDAFEAAGNLKDADWNVSHPRVFTSTRPPDTSGVTPDMVGNQGLYGERSMGAAMASHVRLQQKYTLFEAHQFLRSMQRQAHAFLSTGRTRKHDQRSVREQQREHYGRPDPWDDAVPLPPFVAIEHAPPPTVINDARAVADLYRLQVVEFMGIPDSILSRGSRAGGGNTSKTLTGERTAETHALYYYEQTIGEARLVMQHLFAYIWQSAFGPFAMAEIDVRLDALDAEEETLTIKQMRAMLKKQRGKVNEPECELAFPAEGTLKQTERLAILFKLFEMETLPVKFLQEGVHNAFNLDVTLHEPPPPPAPAGGGGGGGVKRKAPGGGGGGAAKKQRIMETTPATEFLSQ